MAEPKDAPIVERVATATGRGVGSAFVGPLLAASLDAPDVRAAVWRLVVPMGLGVGAGVALGVVVGLWLGGKR